MNAHFKYLRYLLRHKWFVLVAGLRTGCPLWRLLIHDWSKFRPSEWIPYVDYFYRDHKGEGLGAQRQYGLAELAPYGFFAEDRFNIAWNHHQKRNDHHWQYWVLIEDSGEQINMPMPEAAIREMVADWAGAGRAITGKWEVCAWYEKNAEVIRLRDETRLRVEELLRMFGPLEAARHG